MEKEIKVGLLRPSLDAGPPWIRALKKVFAASAAVAAFIFLVPPTPAVTAAEPEQAGGTQPRVRLLTTQQYANTIRYFFGPDIKVDVAFAPLTRTDGLLIAGSSVAGVSDAQVETYQKAAALIAAQVLSKDRRATLVPCKPKAEDAADHACAQRFLTDVTSYLYRDPIANDLLDAYIAHADRAADQLKDFYSGLQLALEGALLGPNMLFVAQESKPDRKNPQQRRLDGYSLAARLSLFLWNAAPDAALRTAAGRGELDTPKGLGRVVDSMLASPRLEDGVRSLFDDMFAFNDFETASKDPAVFPYMVGEAMGDSREQTLLTVVDHLLTKDADYRDLYTTRETFISPALGLIYDVPTTPGWRRIKFAPGAHRDGILTHVSFLALHSHSTRTSPTLRGKALRELLLCQTVPKPPANVDFSALENPKAPLKTTRERVNFHLENPVCAGCHKITDPMGLALENFDGSGKYRTSEREVAIDGTGSLDGKSFTNVDGLTQALRDHPALPKCLVRRTLGFGIGAAVPASLNPAIEDLNKNFAAQGYRLRPLLKQIVMHPSFSTVYDAPPADGVPQKAAMSPNGNSAVASSTKGVHQ